jgi:mono/diheme cytochrome c family protein
VPSWVRATANAVAGLSVLLMTCSRVQVIPASQEQVRRGEYLARAGDCSGCHTAPAGLPFAGGVPFSLPMGTVYSTNITPDLDAGIGNYSPDDFGRVMREGIAKDGHLLYPAMPYTSYCKLSPDDLLALYAYFMQGVQPVRVSNRPPQLYWLLRSRSIMGLWNALYLHGGEVAADASKSASWNRGAYLVQVLGHCGACHTARGIAGQEEATNERDGRQYLAGATLDNWHASNLTGALTGLHAWSKDEVVDFLRSGRTARAAAVGPMAEVVKQSTQYLTNQDLIAISDYLESLPSSSDQGQGDGESTLQATAAFSATRALRLGDTGKRGARVYLDNCNACHRSDGSGASRTFPALARSEAVRAGDPTSLIHIVLAGASMPSTQTAPSAFAMPDFGWRLSDAEVADVLTFVRGSWGNHATAVSADQVVRLRKALAVQKTAR